MEQGQTLEQLQSQGAIPVSDVPKGQGMTLEQLQSQGATPTDAPKTKFDAGGFWSDATNFLFPVIRDVKDIVKGQNKRTALQIAGDTALSAVPFIPFAGETIEGLRAGAKGVQVASDIVKGAETAKEAGLLSKTLKGAATGYGIGVASNLSQGKDIGESLSPNLNTITSTIAGGAFPLAQKGWNSLAESVSGINPQIKTELQRMSGDPANIAKYEEYMNAAKTHSTDLRATPPLTLAADHLDDAANKVTTKLDVAGKAVAAAKATDGAKLLNPHDIKTAGNALWKDVQDKFGLNLFTNPDGTVTAKAVEGSLRKPDASTIKRIEDMATQLNKLSSGKATVGNATDILSNFNELVDHSQTDIYGHTNDPLEATIKHTAGVLNDGIRNSASNLAAANDAYSALKDLQSEIASMAGKSLNKGELLIKRVFSGDKSGDVTKFFDKIQANTGIDLTKEAVLARHAIESVGSKADKTLLQQYLESANQGSTMTDKLLNTAATMGKKTLANPEKIGMSYLKDTANKSGIISKLTNAATKEASRAPGLLNQ